MLSVSTLPPDFQKTFKKLSPEAKARWQEERTKALTDGLFLGAEVMGGDFQEIPHRGLFNQMLKKDPEQQTPLYDLDLKIKKRMILWPRGLFKTSGIVVEIVQLILNFPNIRICFLTGGDTLAKRQLARIKKVFEKPTQKFRNLFPEFCGEKLGTQDAFTVPARTNDSFPEATMSISTAKSVKAGSHYDVIFVDDLVNETNYKSPKSLQKCIDDYKDICPLLAPDGFMYVTGTRYSFGDLYEDIQRLAKEEISALGSSPWKFSILPCWVRYCKTCGCKDINHDFDSNMIEPACTLCACKGFIDSGVKDVLFPKFRCKDGRTEGHTVEFLQSERFRLGDEFFANQYENNPIATGTQTFTTDIIHAQTLFHESQWPSILQAPTFFVGDLSYVGNDKRDQSVVYVCRFFQGQIFVIDCISGKWDSAAVAQNLFDGMLKYRPVMIWLERFLGWEAYNNVFLSFAQNKGVQRFPVDWLLMSNVDGAKKIRIGTIKGVLTERRLWLNANMPCFDILCEQLKKWPKLGRHDDYADCLGLVCSVPTGYQWEKPPAQNTQSWLRKLHQPQENIDEPYPDNGLGSGFCA